MSVKQVTLVSALAVGAALLGYGMAGCELIASVDRTLIPSGTGGTGATGGVGGVGGIPGGSGGVGGVGGIPGGSGGAPPATCTDDVQNGTETDIDCGGDDCPACANNQHCGDYHDCMSGFCDDTEATPTCKACTGEPDCAAATDTWCDPSANGGSCVAKQALGAACVAANQGAECLSGFCADDVCCDTACDGACDACSQAGSCTPLTDGEPGDPACAPYVCDGALATCPTTCTVQGDCVDPPAAYCDASNHCIGTKPDGDACVNGTECLSTFCVDLVCCGVAACGTTGDCNVCLSGTGTCGTALVDHACNDANLCNGADQCDGAGSAAANCSIHSGNPCAGSLGDGDANCSEACNPANGNCDQPENSGACDDGAACNGTDTCSSGTCSVHSGDPCTPTGDCSHACHPANGQCTDPETGTSCDDSTFCNGADTCQTGACTGHAGDPCEADTCHTCSGTQCNLDAGGCFIGSQCYANGAANPANSCQYCDATGSPTAWANRAAGYLCATDSDPCTLDACDASQVCTHTAGCTASPVVQSDGSVRLCVTDTECDAVGFSGACTSVYVPAEWTTPPWETSASANPPALAMHDCTTYWVYTSGVLPAGEHCYYFWKNETERLNDPQTDCASFHCGGTYCSFTTP